MKLFATCARGLEDVSAGEVASIVGACGAVAPDKVFFAATWAQVCDLQVRARTLHKVHRLLGGGAVKGLDDIAASARAVDWAAVVRPDQAFAVRPTRAGAHGFTSLDVGRVVGKVVAESVKASRGAMPRVDLERPDVELTALVRDDELTLGLNLTGESLHRRGYRVYQHAAPLRPSLAAALLLWAGYRPDEGLWDPLCGSGTIPIEAALMARRRFPNAQRGFLMERLPDFPADTLRAARQRAVAETREETFPILGSDINEAHLLGAAENARAAGVWDTLVLRHLDVTQAMPEDLPFAPGLVAANPPYGLRIGSKKVVLRLYRDFFERVRASGAKRLVALVGNRWFEDHARARGLEPVEARDVMYGELGARAVRYDLTGEGKPQPA